MANDDGVSQTRNIDIVCAVYKHDMNKTHTSKQGNDAQGHDLVFAEEALIANVTTRQTDSYDDCGEDSAPPAVQESRVVGEASSAVWGSSVVQMARYYHAAV